MTLKTVSSRLITLAALLMTPLWIFSAPGDLDTTFGGTGTVVLPGDPYAVYKAVREFPDGSLLVLGTNTSGYLQARKIKSNGSIINSFGFSGNASWYGIPANPYILGVALDAFIQSDGKILISGSARIDGDDFNRAAIWRFNSDGVLDQSFGTDGRVLLSSTEGEAAEIEVRQSKIYVAYTRSTGTYLSRRTSGGGLDITFGNFGVAQLSTAGATANYIDMEVAAADGKVYIAGASVRRFNANGSVDNSYGLFGTAPLPVFNTCPSTPNPISFGFTSIAFTSGGKMAAAGMMNTDIGGAYFWITGVTRYTTTGQVDSTFNGGEVICGGGIVGPTFGMVASQSNGKILLGSFSNGFALLRLNTDGAVDTTYNPPDDPMPVDVIVQSDGKGIVLFGNRVQRLLP